MCLQSWNSRKRVRPFGGPSCRFRRNLLAHPRAPADIACQADDGDDPNVSSPDKAKAALGRIEIPPDAVERIAERVTPGSSLIVSDHGLSRETGNETDFIVVMQ